MLLFVTINCWTRSFTLGYWPLFYFSSIFDSNEDKNLYRENILSNEYVCCLFTINHILDSQLVTVGSCIILHQVVVRSTKVRHMNCLFTLTVIDLWVSHLTYSLGSRYNQLSIGVKPYFGCVSCIGKIYKICFATGWYYVFLSSLSQIRSHCLFETWVARVR